mgnify:CR=1 FL=1
MLTPPPRGIPPWFDGEESLLGKEVTDLFDWEESLPGKQVTDPFDWEESLPSKSLCAMAVVHPPQQELMCYGCSAA